MNSMWIDGTIELPDLWFERQNEWTGVQPVVRHTLDGTVHIFEQTKGGEAVDIVGSENRGIMTADQIEAVKQLASQPRAQYVLTVDGTDYNFRFRNEDFPPVESEKIETRTFQDGSDHRKNVRITIMFL